jgi:peptidoglycan hydrolase-like protein with peptidoglycan-binding domain
MDELERLQDDDVEVEESEDQLPGPETDEALAEEATDRDKAGGMVDLQLEHGSHDHGYDEPPSRVDDEYDEGKKGKAKAPAVTLGSVRFSDDAKLLKVRRNKSTLEKGASGIHVTKIQQALAELGHLDGAKVTGTYDKDTVAAVKLFQAAKGLAEDGVLGFETMRELDAAFGGYSVEAGRAQGKAGPLATEGVPYDVTKTPKELLEGTHKPTKKEAKAFAKAISTEQVADSSGKLPKFKNKVKGKTYESRLEALVDKLIDNQLVWAKESDTARSAGHMYDWGDINKVATESKLATDGVFGKYARGAALSGTGVAPNIKDAWEHKEKELKADPAVADEWAMWRVEKLLTGSKAVRALDDEHGAIQSRSKEKVIVDAVHTRLATARKADLVLIHKAWPAFASGNDVFIQRIQERDSKGGVDNAKGRDYMWEMFQTVIHEYIHTLEHPEHVKYRGGMEQQKGGFTLREGVTDYFTKIAYNATPKSDTLRKAIEGPFHENGVVHAVPELTTYGESVNAERGAAIVGFDNMAAAFFLGHVDLIGKT